MTDSNFSAFTWSRSKRYYLTHPWKWFQQLFYNLKHARQRIVRGYADDDVFCFFEWFLHVIPSMLQDLADDNYGGYPGFPPFDTPEKWSIWLHEQSQRLISCREEERDKRNQYYEEYMKSFDMKLPENGETKITFDEAPNHKEVSQLYFAREKELYEEARQTLRDTFAQLAEWFYALWS